jgi:transcriptional regulator with XRE-family HTH domain
VSARRPDPKDIAHLAEALFDARRLRGYSRRALAEASGVSARLIAEFEMGKKAPTRAQLRAIWGILADDVIPVRR